MSEEIKYIKRVEISKLWGHLDIEWDLHPDVNILAGVNGSGKSTILNIIHLNITDKRTFRGLPFIKSCNFIFNNEKNLSNVFALIKSEWESYPKNSTLSSKEITKQIHIDFINTFENELIHAEAIQKLSADTVSTDLDWQIYQLQKQYVDYQLNLSKKKDLIFENGGNHQEQFEKLRYSQKRFLDILDELFKQTKKRVNRKSNEIEFLLNDEIDIKPHQLSSGEKQLLIILMTILVQDNQPSILFMDEPEVSLHIEWQKKLIGFIRELNPNVQLIIATHSPAMIMDGWMDKVFNVEDITVKQPK